jgi:2-phospho-L-lactate guanylyltransferase
LTLASQYDFQVIADHANSGETDAIAMATHICEARGLKSTLVIPADIPLIRAEELQEIYAVAPEEGSVLVPAGDGRGTNAALRKPAGLFPLRFGNDSFKPHLAAAQAAGKPCIVLPLSGIGADVDNPADLKQLIELPGDTLAQRLARQWDLRDYPVAANE